MEMILFTGLQASGKSSFYKERFWNSHIRINLDMLKTRHREEIILHACLAARQPLVVDNTNPQRATRERYRDLGRACGFSVHLYYFRTDPESCIRRNEMRPERQRVPERAIRGTFAKFEEPLPSEGWDRFFIVEPGPEKSFLLQEKFYEI